MATIDESMVESLLVARIQAQNTGMVVSMMGDPDAPIESGGRQIRLMSVTLEYVPRCSTAGTHVARLTAVAQVSAGEAEAISDAGTATGDAQRLVNSMSHAALIDAGTTHTIHLAEAVAEELSLQAGASPRARAKAVTIKGLVVRTSGLSIAAAAPA